jgi:hypothetical protein
MIKKDVKCLYNVFHLKGADAMIAIFSDFPQFLAKNAVLRESQCYDQFFA